MDLERSRNDVAPPNTPPPLRFDSIVYGVVAVGSVEVWEMGGGGEGTFYPRVLVYPGYDGGRLMFLPFVYFCCSLRDHTMWLDSTTGKACEVWLDRKELSREFLNMEGF